MNIKFDSKEVKQAFNEIAKLGGHAKKIDTKNEFTKLSEYLSNNRDNMSANDINTIEGLCIERTTSVPKQKATVNVDINGDNNKTQVIAGDNNVVINGDVQNSGNLAIGNNNEQNQYGTAPVQEKEEKKEVEIKNKQAPKADEKPVKEKPSDKGKPKTDKPETDKPEMKKLKQGEQKKDYLRDDFGYYYIDDSGKKHYVKNPKEQEIKGALVYESVEHAYGALKEQGLYDLANAVLNIYRQQGNDAVIKFLRDYGVVVGKIGTF